MPTPVLIFAGAVALAAAGWFFKYVRAVYRGDETKPEGKTPWWGPGQGTHGSDGGQNPPLVPYNPDWDEENRIR
jgi:hypothetical protein